MHGGSGATIKAATFHGTMQTFGRDLQGSAYQVYTCIMAEGITMSVAGCIKVLTLALVVTQWSAVLSIASQTFENIIYTPQTH